MSHNPRSEQPVSYRRRPDVVEAMQWKSPDNASMQDVLTWLREEGQVFKTVGRQLWIGFEKGESWMVLNPGDYIIRKTEGWRYFYAEPAHVFEEGREPVAGLLLVLHEIHEYHCGCDTPGRLDRCVAEPQDAFEVLDESPAVEVKNYRDRIDAFLEGRGDA